MGLYTVETYFIECDDCGQMLAEDQSEYDAVQDAYEHDAVEIEGDWFCSYCADEYRVCDECEVTFAADESHLVDSECKFVDYLEDYCYCSLDCFMDAHRHIHVHVTGDDPPILEECGPCEVVYGPSLNNTGAFKVPNPIIQREKETA